MVLNFVISAIVSYLLGSLNFAIIVSHRVNNDDIRNYGSHNAGLTNMLRTYGKNEAILTCVGDMLKGIISVLGTYFLFELTGYEGFGRFPMVFSMFFVMVGHVFPIFYHFKGGKGVLTSAACLLIIDWRVFVTIISVFLIILAISKYVSLASCIATVTAVVSRPLYDYLFDGWHDSVVLETALLAVIGATIIIKHHTNIKRLINGTENKISVKKG